MMLIRIGIFLILSVSGYSLYADSVDLKLVSKVGVGNFKYYRNGRTKIDPNFRVHAGIFYFDETAHAINTVSQNDSYDSAEMEWNNSGRGDREKYPYPRSLKFNIGGGGGLVRQTCWRRLKLKVLPALKRICLRGQ